MVPAVTGPDSMLMYWFCTESLRRRIIPAPGEVGSSSTLYTQISRNDGSDVLSGEPNIVAAINTCGTVNGGAASCTAIPTFASPICPMSIVKSLRFKSADHLATKPGDSAG